MRRATIIVRAALVVALTLFASVAICSERIQVDVGDSPTLGPPDAPVTMVEFIDYQ